jgi:hypothetical protein
VRARRRYEPEPGTTFAYQIVIHTPPWVWMLLAYLVWHGLKAMQPRTVPIWRALIVPVVFIVWALSRIGFGHQDNVWPLIAWIAVAAPWAADAASVRDRSQDRRDHPARQRVRLIRNLVVFGLQYVVSVISAIDVGDRALAIIAGRSISGATAGYFIGSTIAMLVAYRRKRG